MNYEHKVNAHHEDVYCNYDISLYRDVMRKRWDPYNDKPIEQAAGLCYTLRRVVNSDESRQIRLLEIMEEHPKVIIFYNYNYELEILRNLYYGDDVTVAEYNGQKHQDIPTGSKWVYLCQYTAAAEGWECIKTNCIVFYSQNYSYKITTQAAGRIDRLNSPFSDLYYYHLKTRSGIDLAISKALSQKKKFNETRWVKW
jgi:superfamily II DNA or RNA helicase